MDNYEHWLQIAITHEYYTNTPLRVIPTPETKYFMDKAGIRLRQMHGGLWILIRQKGEMPDQRWQLWTDEDIQNLCFELRPSIDEFYYVSVWDKSKQIESEATLVDSLLPNVWKMLNIPFAAVKNLSAGSIDLRLETQSRYWEYILIPKHNKFDIQLKLQEEKNRIQFRKMEEVNLLGESTVFRFSTIELLKMNELNNFRMELNEVRASGERLLSNCIPNPKPDECSPISPKDTITTYYYF